MGLVCDIYRFVLPVAANVVQRHIDSVERAAELAKRLPKTEIMNKVKKRLLRLVKGVRSKL